MVSEKIQITDSCAKNIKYFRKKSHIRTDTLSSQINKGAAYISQIENRKIRSIQMSDLQAIADILGCETDIILNFDFTENECIDRENERINRKSCDINNKLILENIELKKENEFLKAKLAAIMKIAEN